MRLSRLLSETRVNRHLRPVLREEMHDISFGFSTEKVPTVTGVLLHEKITIRAFPTPDQGTMEVMPYHLIFGESSLAIFDAFRRNEIAGLTRADCEKHIKNLPDGDESDDAFIAGLSNWAGDQPFQFFNVNRLLYPGMANRVIPHESLHMSRMLITLHDNEYVRQNQGKPNWWADERSAFTPLEDDNEECFAETLERVSAVAFARWGHVQTTL